MFDRKNQFIVLLCEILGLLMFSLLAWPAEKSKLAFTADVTWASKYVVSGFEVGGDHPVWQLSGLVDIYKSGFSVMYWTALQTERANKQYDEQDFLLLYGRDFFKEKPYALNLHGFYDYWVFPNAEPVVDESGEVIDRGRKHGNKFNLGFSFPNLIPLSGSYLVPTYNAYYIHYWALNREDMYQGGAQHELLLEYDHGMSIWFPGASYQYYGLKASTLYRNGDFGVKPGHSHSIASGHLGVYALSSIFVLGLNHQWTHEKTVNLDNEFWTTLSYIKKF